MRILVYDLETTGLLTGEDRITELGFVLWDTELKRPLTCADVFLHDETYPPLTEEITRLTGITDGMLKEFGTSPKDNLIWLERFCEKHRVDYLCAHNLTNFDHPFLMAELKRHGVEAPYLRALPMIDTKTDLPFASEPDSRKLKHLAMEIGVINHFPHRAITDVLTACLVLAHYPIEDVIAYSKIPFVTVRAMVSYDDRQLAKDQRFSWEKIGEKSYPKSWIKNIKQNQLEKEREKCKFPIVVLS